jgi:HNH endonuclease
VPIPAALRAQVFDRAGGRCEYCRVHEDDLPFSHQIDHVIPLRHGGRTESQSLALACLECNRRKGADLSAIDPVLGTIAAIFNPRIQSWAEHFLLEGVRVLGRTPTGRATVALLRLNDSTRVLERLALADAGRYPVA